MSITPEERLQFALQSLEGLRIADSMGGHYELAVSDRIVERTKTRRLPAPIWRFTDDTNMALSIVSILRQYGEIDQDKLAHSFGKNFERSRGYGMGARSLLIKIQLGGSWRELTYQLFGGGSYGNGSAMRVPPLGAYFADDLEKVKTQAALSSEITHAHPEGIAGGIAVAIGAAMSWQLRGQPKPSIPDFLDRVLPYVPESEVKAGIEKARLVEPDTPIQEIVATLGNGSLISSQDTVPYVLWNAACYLDQYEEAVWATISGGGDTDTTAAMVGGIVVLYTGAEAIPQKWRDSSEPLPRWYLEEITP